jgi:hypothetical protein
MRLNHLLKTTMFMMAVDPKSGSAGGGDDEADAKLAEVVAAAVAAALPKALNGAITSHLNRAMAKVEERFSKLEKPTGDEGDGEEGGEGGVTPPAKPGKGVSPEVAQELAAMRKQLETTKKQLADEKAARDKAVAETREREDRGKLQEALMAAGVQKHMLGPAVAYLHGEQKRLKRGEDGEVYFIGDDKTEVSVADGVKAWAKSETGMGFMPARDVGGSGGTGARKPGAGGAGAQPDTSDKAIIDMLLG